MSFKLTKKEIKYLKNPDEVLALASFLKEIGGSTSEREIYELRKKRIKEKILGHEMRPFCWAIGHIPALDITQRVDGQHSSEVFLGLKNDEWEQVDFPVIIDWEEYECERRIDIAVLFEQFNPSWSARDTEDLAGAHMGQYEHFVNYPRKLATRINKGLSWYARHVKTQRQTPGSQFQFFHENHDITALFSWGKTVLHATRYTRLHYPPVLAAMYHTTRSTQKSSQREAALIFWKDVARGYQFLEDTETLAYRLDVFLEDVMDKKHEWPNVVKRQFKGNQHHPSDQDVFVTCLRVVARAVRNATLPEIFLSAKDRSLSQWIETLYPLPLVSPEA